MPVILVPQGAEERAIRRAAPDAPIVAVGAGASASALPDDLAGGLVVVLGLCGALRDLRTGDCAIFTDVTDDAGCYTFDPDLVRALRAVLPAAIPVHGCTVDHVVTRATERAALAAAYGAQAVDMEGTHVARALSARGRPSLIVRVVSDDPAYDLPRSKTPSMPAAPSAPCTSPAPSPPNPSPQHASSATSTAP